MRRRTFNALFTGALSLRNLRSAETTNDLRLWYRKPAAGWLEALALGNGRLGAMVSGGFATERIYLNESSLYSEEPRIHDVPIDITPDFERVVAMLRRGDYLEADQYISKHWLGRAVPCYQPVGNLLLHFDGSGEPEEYERELDLTEAVSRVRYRRGGIAFEREAFASYPDDVVVLRLRADRPGVLQFRVGFESPHPDIRTSVAAKDEIAFTGQAPGIALRRTLDFVEQQGDQSKYPEIWDSAGDRKFEKTVLYGNEVDGRGTRFEVRVRIIPSLGAVSNDESGLTVKGAQEAVLLVTAATSFNGFDKSPSREGVDPSIRTRPAIEKAARRSYAQLREAHVADYSRLFKRVSLRLGEPGENSGLPSDERLANAARDGADSGLISLFFNFGRYLLISCSRPHGQPANLQGLWNLDVIPPWGSAYTTNVNLQMNYWPAEVANLSECHEPLFQLLRDMSVTGARVAKAMYHRPGWVMHHNTTIWRSAYPVDWQAYFSMWPMAGGWLCQHLWEHYRFTLNQRFLRETAYPILKGAAEFFESWLTDDGNGRLTTPVSSSPEHHFIYTTRDGTEKTAGVCQGSLMDSAIIHEVFRHVVEACAVLGLDADFRARLESKIQKLPLYQIGNRGQILEYGRDFKDTPGHNTSPFYPLFPGDQITPSKTPEWAEAERKLLELRARSGVGWPGAWHTCAWARLGDSARAYAALSGVAGRSIHPNFFHGSGQVFQIDANLGAVAGVAEMLLQSHEGEIRFLPALPPEWPDGEVKGLCARGAVEVDMSWRGGRLLAIELRPATKGIRRLQAATGQEIQSVSAGGKAVAIKRLSDAVVEVSLNAGQSYQLRCS